MIDLETAFRRLPLIAILRGVAPGEAVEVGRTLVQAGFTLIEVPLNSPDPFRSIERLADALAGEAVIGAGTVMTAGEVARLRMAGGKLVVMPHCDAAVIRAATAAGLACCPGIATPTEGFAALAAGADMLKLFPAEAMPPEVVRAYRAVFPRSVRFIPVGGIGAGNMAAYRAAGADGFGIGSTLYQPGRSVAEIGRRAAELKAAWVAAAAARRS